MLLRQTLKQHFEAKTDVFDGICLVVGVGRNGVVARATDGMRGTRRAAGGTGNAAFHKALKNIQSGRGRRGGLLPAGHADFGGFFGDAVGQQYQWGQCRLKCTISIDAGS